MGHSNGGFMTYHIACQYPDLVAGIIVISGANFFDNEYCKSLNKKG
jgi:dipeptidyl aminopeptidase/acylaminoacyl peptidase